MASTSQLAQTPRATAAPGEVLVIVCAGVVLASLDLFIVNVALPRIAVDLHEPDLGRLSWVLNAYAIVYAALLVFFGRLADRYRRDRGFLLGVAIFTAASAGCALSVNLEMLVGLRVLQAAGAALLTPTSLGLVLASFPAERRAGAVRAWTATGGAAAALGPVVGGLLVSVDWRWVFLVNVPIGLLALAVGWRRLPAVPGHDIEAPDALGAVLVTGGVGALTLALVEGSTWGWSDAATLGALAAAALLLAGFVAHCLRARSPLVTPELFSTQGFSVASVITLLHGTAFAAMIFSAVLVPQEVWGWSPLRTGFAVAVGPLMVPIVAFGVAGRLIARFGPGPVIAAGCLSIGAGTAWFALHVTAEPHYATAILPGMLATGVGVGLSLPTIMAAAAGSLPPSAFSTGSAVVNMIRQTGMALGVAIVVAILASAAAPVTGFHRAWWTTSALTVVAALVALVGLRVTDGEHV
ncbi:MFS transporter [Spongisporangium articulatum]|uniref:MFS transporter n=1 Tax=Spongisporangium articulatum TaxID=3362603 RepID=A0ABW8AQS5_9ACTN